MVNEYKLTAPNIDFLLDKFEDSSMRPSMPSEEVMFGSGEKGHSRVGQKGPIRVE